MNKKITFLFWIVCAIIIVFIAVSNIFPRNNEKEISPPAPKTEIMTNARKEIYQPEQGQKHQEEVSAPQKEPVKEPPLPAGEPLLY